MSKLSRIRRDMKRRPLQTVAGDALATAGAKGFDLRTAQLTDLDEVRLDAESNELSVTLSVPVDNGESFASYEETFSLGDDDAPDYLKGAARQFAGAIVRAVRERVMLQGDVPCATCTAPCCARAFDHVEVTAQDVERMEAAGIDIDKTIEHYEQESWTGHVGTLNRVPWFGADGYMPPAKSGSLSHSLKQELGEDDADDVELCCPHLTKAGCGIYEHRPLVCREYSAWTCELYDADDEKLEAMDAKRKLTVVA